MKPRFLRPSVKEMQRQEAALNRKIAKAIQAAKDAELAAKLITPNLIVEDTVDILGTEPSQEEEYVSVAQSGSLASV